MWVVMSSALAHIFLLVAPDWDKPLLGPRFSVSTLIAMCLGIVAALILWFHKDVNRLAMEVAVELRNVTWPTWPETRLSTIVVLVTTIVVSLILGLFDAIWGAVTTFIYKL